MKKGESEIMKREKLVARFLSTYLCALLPVLSVSLLISKGTLENLKQKEISNIAVVLQNYADRLDSLFYSYEANSYSIIQQAQLSPGNMIENDAKALEGITFLRNLNGFDSQLTDIAIYYGRGRIYSARGTTSVAPYFYRLLGLGEEGKETAEKTLASREAEVALLHDLKYSGYLMFHYPVQVTATYGYDTSLNYLISLPAVAEMLPDIGSSMEYTVNVRLGESGFCYSVSEDGLQFQNFRMVGEDSGRGLVRICVGAKKLDMEIECAFDSNSLYRSVNVWQNTITLVLILGMLLSALLAYQFCRRRVRDLEELENFVADSGAEKASAVKRTSEFFNVQSMIQRIWRESSALMENIGAYQSALKQQMALNLFHGSVHDRKALSCMLDACGMEISEEYFFLGGFLLEISEKQNAQIRELLANDLFCETDIGGKKALVFFMELPNCDSAKRIRERIAQSMREILTGVGMRQAKLGISRVYDDISMAQYAYLEICSILEKMSKEVKSSDTFCYMFESEKETQQTQALDPVKLQPFSQAVMKQNLGEANASLKKLEQLTADSSISEENKAYFRLCILNAFALAINQIGNLKNQKVFLEVAKIDPNNGQPFFKSIRDVLLLICSARYKQTDSDQIVRYIEKNYMRCDLSLEDIAQEFGVSKNYLSRMFRLWTGECYIDYLTEIRMKKVVQMLEKTEIPIADVFKSAGYADKTNYSKKFKARFGISASEYRRQHQKLTAEKGESE